MSKGPISFEICCLAVSCWKDKHDSRHGWLKTEERRKNKQNQTRKQKVNSYSSPSGDTDAPGAITGFFLYTLRREC